jgi:hypothetical protein
MPDVPNYRKMLPNMGSHQCVEWGCFLCWDRDENTDLSQVRYYYGSIRRVERRIQVQQTYFINVFCSTTDTA